jgi:hypothetical protein
MKRTGGRHGMSAFYSACLRTLANGGAGESPTPGYDLMPVQSRLIENPLVFIQTKSPCMLHLAHLARASFNCPIGTIHAITSASNRNVEPRIS